MKEMDQENINNQDRDDGFYWVILDDTIGWEIARYDKSMNWWYYTGWDAPILESSILSVDENRIKRESNESRK
jgi:hypothetical protein